MPEIPLLHPTVLNGVIQKFTGPPDLRGVKLLPTRSWPFPTLTFDIVKGSRQLAVPNVPNSEANIVAQRGVAQVSYRFIYVREKKVFEPTTLHWLRMPGELARANAERRVLEEMQDLDNRIWRLKEYCVWKMFSGSLVLDTPKVKANIDYQIPATHKPTAAVLWTEATSDPIGDIAAWKRLITGDAEAVPTIVVCNEWTMSVITKNSKIQSLMSDRQKDSFFSSGKIPQFQGLDWETYDLGYVDDSGALQRFIPDGYIVILAPAEDAWIMYEGPAADDEAPDGHTGRFAKTWKEKDPSSRQALIELNYFPALQRPDNIVYAKIANPPA